MSSRKRGIKFSRSIVHWLSCHHNTYQELNEKLKKGHCSALKYVLSCKALIKVLRHRNYFGTLTRFVRVLYIFWGMSSRKRLRVVTSSQRYIVHWLSCHHNTHQELYEELAVRIKSVTKNWQEDIVLS